MFSCPTCGREVLYLTSGIGSLYLCDADKKTVITDTAHKVDGYPIHVCFDRDGVRYGKDDKERD